MASEWQTAFVVSHKMPLCALLTAVKNYNLEKLQDFLQDRNQDQMFKTKTKTSWSKTKTKTFIFVLEAPRNQDHGLEDYITGLSVIDSRDFVLNSCSGVVQIWRLCSY